MAKSEPRKAVSVIIPAYNEEKTIGETVRYTHDYLSGKVEFEILVILDGCVDRTRAEVRKVQRNLKNIRYYAYWPNVGKGYAVRKGLMLSRYPTKIIIDADNSIRVLSLGRFFGTSREHELFRRKAIMADRVQVIRQPWQRLMLGKLFKVIVWVLFGIYADTQAPMKILNMPEKFYRELHVNGFAYDVELWYKLKQHKVKIKTEKMIYRNNPDSKVTSWKMLMMLGELWQIYCTSAGSTGNKGVVRKH